MWRGWGGELGEWLGGGKGGGENGRFSHLPVTNHPQQANDAGEEQKKEEKEGEGVETAGQS